MENKVCGFTVLFLLCILRAVTMHTICASATPTVSCGNALSELASCGGYLVGHGTDKPSTACCTAVSSLDHMAKTTAERKLLCQCFQDTASSFGVSLEKASKLPILCKLNIKVAPGMNCNKYVKLLLCTLIQFLFPIWIIYLV